MHFTQEDYKKIENWLLRNSVKDSEFQDALPLNGSETVVITQNGHNRNMTVQELSNKVLELGVSDFINVSDNFDTYGISLIEAINLIPFHLRKKGVIITFCNTENNWEIYQFTGALNQWNNVTLWNDIFNIERYAVNSLLPDEEDTTRTEIDKNGNSYIKLKDKEYNPLEFSGYGKKTLRKKIVIVKTSPKNSKRINILEGSVFKDSNTIYEIKYDFDLNNSTITLPENCILLFNGGKISNGKLNLNNTLVYPLGIVKEDVLECTTVGNFKEGQIFFDKEQGQLSIWDGTSWKSRVNYKVVDNKLNETLDGGKTWTPVSDYISANFRWSPENIIQINRTGKEEDWEDLSYKFANNVFIKGYIASYSALPSNPSLGDIYMVGAGAPYTMYVYTSDGWVNNGSYTSIAAGVVQTTGQSTTEVMSQRAVTDKLTELSEELGQYETNDEYLRAYTDSEGRFLFGIKNDGSIEWSKGIPLPIRNEIFEIKEGAGTYVSNEEYIRAYIDEEEKFLWGIKKDGSIEWSKGVPKPIAKEIKKITNRINDVAETITHKESDDLLYAIVDEQEHIVVGLKKDGAAILGKNALTQLQKDLIANGFSQSPIDWSNESSITLPIPRYCAKVNIISKTGLAKTKTDNKDCYLEYWDKSGNYFKKRIVLNAQGSSSMSYIEKNQSIDILNEDGESCEITFGNWVAQDSYHLKCYYIDVFRGICNIAYKWCEEVIKAMNCRNNRIIRDYAAITTTQSSGDYATDFGDRALCHPDGFPFELYVNGEYYGLYAWNLKKHRKNYSMNKKDYTKILLDGDIWEETFFGGSINWEMIELRNPKDLITMDGSKYDGENPKELIDATSSAYDSSNEVHVKTAQVKAALQRQANAIAHIRTATNEQEGRRLYESYYDKEMMKCYFIVANVLYHLDGLRKNWIWTFYGDIAAPTFYDMDSIFGRNWKGTEVISHSTDTIIGLDEDITTLTELVRLYKDEIETDYKMLRDCHVIDTNTIMNFLNKWIDEGAIEKNLEKWTSIPSYRSEKTIDDGTEEGGMYDSPKRIELWLNARINTLDDYFNYR